MVSGPRPLVGENWWSAKPKSLGTTALEQRLGEHKMMSKTNPLITCFVHMRNEGLNIN